MVLAAPAGRGSGRLAGFKSVEEQSSIKTKNARLDPGGGRLEVAAAPGDYVLLRARDPGHGIAPH